MKIDKFIEIEIFLFFIFSFFFVFKSNALEKYFFKQVNIIGKI